MKNIMTETWCEKRRRKLVYRVCKLGLTSRHLRVEPLVNFLNEFENEKELQSSRKNSMPIFLGTSFWKVELEIKLLRRSKTLYYITIQYCFSLKSTGYHILVIPIFSKDLNRFMRRFEKRYTSWKKRLVRYYRGDRTHSEEHFPKKRSPKELKLAQI